MAEKLVVLKFYGNLHSQGFTVALEVSEERQRATTDCSANLPADPELAAAISSYWQEHYQPLAGDQSRGIRPGAMPYGGSISPKIEECKRSGKKLKAGINHWLQSSNFRPLLDSLLQQLQAEDEVRVLIRTDDELLHKLPWECWKIFNDYPKAQYCYSSHFSAPPPRRQDLPRRNKVRILAILGESDRINVDADLMTLEQLSDVAEIVVLCEPRSEEINDELWAQPWDIIFFAGHSYTEGETGVIRINPDEALPIEQDSQVWFGLQKAVQQGLQLVIFNSCDGFGLAKQLDILHVPQVIFMREFVVDFAAQKFLQYFLRAYIGGDSLSLAVREAKEKLRGITVEIDGCDEKIEVPYAEWLPVLWQNPAVFPPKWEELLPPVTKRTFPARRRCKIGTVAIASLAIAALVFGARWQGKLQPLELKAYDFFMQQRAIEPRDNRLLVIRITPDDRDRLKQSPDKTGQGSRTLSDRNLDRLFEKLEGLQPAAIGLLIAREGSISSQYPHFKAALEGDRTIVMCQFKTESQQGTAAPEPVARDRVGFFTTVPDADGVLRRHLLSQKVSDRFPCKGDLIDSFSLQVAQHYLQKQGGYRLDLSDDNFIQIGSTRYEPLKLHRGGYHHPDSGVEGGIQTMLNYRPYRDYQTDIARVVSLTDFFDDQLTPKDVRDRIVLIGRNFKDEGELTPYNPTAKSFIDKTPGLFIVAQEISSILSNVEQKIPLIWAWDWWGDALWIWGWSLTGGLLYWFLNLWKTSPIKGLALLILSYGLAWATLYGLCLLFFFNGGWLPFVPATLGLFLTGATISLYQALKNIKFNP
ncbi:CHASE2 domain-containing protein [Oscillatoria sp. FACHB-1406]|uniref:CHASE2 domain-containing protein n=1 Tax=Oscillatoria sp. FACHB-1406 TaxID=2692846 RepID=UPI0016893DD5|nr:CHASE2 domain-containing protein [Oscillatoria sp. FACHB-1406]MBD2578368.1 CHASE2 domain-containing protein [Oscillatoria sp. FACHB-1406]